MPRNEKADVWDGRTLEWATHSPVPEYNFAVVPTVTRLDEYWFAKKKVAILLQVQSKNSHAK